MDFWKMLSEQWLAVFLLLILLWWLYKLGRILIDQYMEEHKAKNKLELAERRREVDETIRWYSELISQVKNLTISNNKLVTTNWVHTVEHDKILKIIDVRWSQDDKIHNKIIDTVEFLHWDVKILHKDVNDTHKVFKEILSKNKIIL